MWVHATAIVIGEAGVLIRGCSGVGKTTLALALVTQSRLAKRFSRLVADDRVGLQACNDRLIARPHRCTMGLVERRGLGIIRAEHEPACLVRLIVDLVAPDSVPERPARMPEPEELWTKLLDVTLPRLVLLSTTSALDNTCRVLEFCRMFRPGS